MAKTSAIERNKKRRSMAARFAEKRTELKRVARDESLTLEERFQARHEARRASAELVARAHSQPL